MIGRRHRPECLCGCQFVVGLVGEVVETITIARFEVPNEAGGPPREELVAYSDLTDAAAREAGS